MQDLEIFTLPLFTYNECVNGFTVVPGALRWENRIYPVVAHEGVPGGEVEIAQIGLLESLDVTTAVGGVQTVWGMGRVTPGSLHNEPESEMVRHLMPSYTGGIHATGLDGCQTLVQGAVLVRLTLVVFSKESLR